jgi:hypothetical protein
VLAACQTVCKEHAKISSSGIQTRPEKSAFRAASAAKKYFPRLHDFAVRVDKLSRLECKSNFRDASIAIKRRAK